MMRYGALTSCGRNLLSGRDDRLWWWAHEQIEARGGTVTVFTTYRGSSLLKLGAVSIVVLAAAACSPTYGTGKSANQQLLEDVTGMMSLQPGGPRQTIQYQPRPDLVRPSNTTVLPSPQAGVTAQRSEQWPESPEERLRRVRASADESGVPTTAVIRDGNTQRIVASSSFDSNDPRAQREEFRRRLTAANQGDPNVRRSLAEPPTTYRQPSESAPVGDVGEPEWRKEAAQRRATGQRRELRDYLPW